MRLSVAGAAVSEAAVSIDHERGRAILATPPAAGAVVRAGFEFDVPVRFDTDRIEASMASFAAGEIPSIPVVEVRV